MFRKNKDHLQTELFNSYSAMNSKIQASLDFHGTLIQLTFSIIWQTMLLIQANLMLRSLFPSQGTVII